MPKGRSYKNDTWASFEKQTYGLFKDDFVHQKLLTVKTNLERETGGINLKQSLTSSGEALSSSGQSKLWFQLKNDRSIFTRVQHKALTVSYDHGVQTRQDVSYNLYGSAESTRALKQFYWRGGVQLFSKNWMTNFMLQFNQEQSVLSLYHKASYQKNHWSFSHYKVFDLTNKMLRQTGFLARHRKVTDQKTHDAFFRIQNSPKHQWNFNDSSVHFDVVGSNKNVSAGLQIGSTVGKLREGLKPWLNSITGAVQVKNPQSNTTLKMKVSADSSGAVSMKHLIQNYGSYTWGVQISEIGSKNNIKFGVQIDLNL